MSHNTSRVLVIGTYLSYTLLLAMCGDIQRDASVCVRVGLFFSTWFSGVALLLWALSSRYIKQEER